MSFISFNLVAYQLVISNGFYPNKVTILLKFADGITLY